MAMAGAVSISGGSSTVPFAGDARADACFIAFVWAVVAVIGAAGGYAKAIEVMSTDDAMRLAEVRDFLAGQGWFDLLQRRLNPPDGVLMHWSRLIDLPIATLLAGFGRVFAPETALRLTLTVWPALPLLPAMFAAASVSRSVGGREAGPIGAIMLAMSPGVTGRFTPGMIDHHGPQLALALIMLACALRIGRSDRAAAGAGLAAAAMLAIGMETLPYVAVLAAVIALRWAMTGPALARGAALFGLAFAASVAAVYLATVPFGRWTAPVCDALGVGHLVAAGLGGVGLALATRARGEGVVARLASLGLLGAAVVIGVALVAPACLGDPYAALPQRLRTDWLDRVREARDVATHVRKEPASAIVIIVSVLGGLSAAIWRLAVAPADKRAAVVPAAAALGVACLIAAWQIRGATFALAFGAPFLAAAATAVARSGTDRVRGFIAIAAFNPSTVAYVGVLAGLAIGLPKEAEDQGAGCPVSDYRALSALPIGLALNTIDTGPYIIAFTPSSAVAAPYHRNVDGLTAEIETFTGSEETARATALSRRASYVVVCPKDGGVADYAHRYPASFSAALMSDTPPAWLAPVDLGPGVKLKAYRVAP